MINKGTLKLVAVISLLLLMITFICSMIINKQEDEVLESNKVIEGSTITPMPTATSIPLPIDSKTDVIPEATILPEYVFDIKTDVSASPVLDELTRDIIIISKSEYLDGSEEIELIDLAVDRQLQFIIKGIKNSSFQFTSIYRIMDEDLYDNPIPEPSPTPIPTPTLDPELEPSEEELNEDEISDNSDTLSDSGIDDYINTNHQQNEIKDEGIKSNDPIHSMVVDYALEENGLLSASVTFHLDKTYVYKLVEDEAYYYICLMKPKDVYEKIVVIDAGHGARDSGTYSKNYVYLEKDMNLSILLCLKELLDEDDEITAYYTRTTDRRLTFNQRVNLANDLEADLFLSIHCNSSPFAQVNGSEALYNELQNDWDGMNSKRFAIICLEETINSIGLFDRGIIPRNHNVHILSAAKMPVAIIEAAFMSNSKDLGVLIKEETHKALAEGLYKAIKRAYEEIENQ